MKTHIITQEDIEESARVWASIDLENATRPKAELRVEDEPTVPSKPRRGGINAALAQGWHVDPADSPAPPHEGPCNCAKTKGFLRLCPCVCHGFGGDRNERLGV